jgi:hypothetical protein
VAHEVRTHPQSRSIRAAEHRDLRVERLEQTYRLVSAGDSGAAFHYESPRFDYSAELRYDVAGFVIDYPGIAVRDR